MVKLKKSEQAEWKCQLCGMGIRFAAASGPGCYARRLHLQDRHPGKPFAKFGKLQSASKLNFRQVTEATHRNRVPAAVAIRVKKGEGKHAQWCT